MCSVICAGVSTLIWQSPHLNRRPVVVADVDLADDDVDAVLADIDADVDVDADEDVDADVGAGGPPRLL